MEQTNKRMKISRLFLFFTAEHLDAKKAGDLSTLFDVGGIFGESATLCFFIILKCVENIYSILNGDY